MKKLIAIVITFIFISKNAGYGLCSTEAKQVAQALRLPMGKVRMNYAPSYFGLLGFKALRAYIEEMASEKFKTKNEPLIVTLVCSHDLVVSMVSAAELIRNGLNIKVNIIERVYSSITPDIMVGYAKSSDLIVAFSKESDPVLKIYNRPDVNFVITPFFKPDDYIVTLSKAISKLPEGRHKRESIIRVSILRIFAYMEALIAEAESDRDENIAVKLVRKAQSYANSLTTEQALLILESPDLCRRYIELDERVSKFGLALPYASIVNKPGPGIEEGIESRTRGQI